jgi:arylsulfatase A
MNMQAFKASFDIFRFVAALFLLNLQHIVAAAPAAKPNVILMMADDFGYECVTANGGQSYQTPHLDRLAASGMRFEHCHVQPLCTPTRVQLMTGLYNVRNYLQFGTLVRSETTFAHLMKSAGYATGICGKWQLGREADAAQHFGFDESCLWQHIRRPPRYANPGLEYNGIPKDFSQGEYGPQLVNDFALDFIERHRDAPFFLYYPMILTHDPFQPTPDSPDWDPNAMGEEVHRDVRHFAEMTAYMDQLVGTLDEKLTELGIRDNTLLMFIGDNGTSVKVTSRFQGIEYPGGKRTTTCRGTHVPFIASWPAVIRKPSVNSDLISSVDFLPTLCELAGVPVPKSTDGISLLPLLRGEPGQRREWLYTWFSPRQGSDATVTECAFDHHFKLYRDGRFFDLRTDRFEERPLNHLSEPDAVAAREKFQTVLARFSQVDRSELNRNFAESVKKKAAAADTLPPSIKKPGTQEKD